MMNLPTFPIPVVALGPGSQPDAEVPDFLRMPGGMATFEAPTLPDEPPVGREQAVRLLHEAQRALEAAARGIAMPPIGLAGLPADDLVLVDQVLGEGEVAVRLETTPGVRAQESVFTGLWRVVHFDAQGVRRETLEAGPIPARVAEVAAADGGSGAGGELARPADLMNAPALLEELRDRQAAWRPGTPQHVVNLTLLPLTEGDSLWLDAHVGAGRVAILSRGYGNCRVVDTLQPRTWRVTYFNSQDIVILDTLEVGDVPEVACAAPQDLEDSARRLAEVLEWLEGSHA